MKLKKGVSLIEVLVVIAIFAILGILATRAILLTLQGTKKSESLVNVRENLNYSLAVIERQLRNAESVSCPTPSEVDYTDANGVGTSFSCGDVGPTSGYIASGSARLTGSDITILNCSFTCTPAESASTPSVTISVSAASVGTSGVQGSQVTAETKIFLRTY